MSWGTAQPWSAAVQPTSMTTSGNRVFKRCCIILLLSVTDGQIFPISISAVHWAGVIEPNVGNNVDADVGQTMKLFT